MDEAVVAAADRTNLHYLAMNCMDKEVFGPFLDSLKAHSKGGEGLVAAVCVQFPDPWSKSSRSAFSGCCLVC